LFDNPSVAQQVSDTVRRIVGDTERIRENAGKITRASVIMERNFSKMVNSTSQVAANLGAIVNQLQSASTNAQGVASNLGQASTNANTTAQHTKKVNTKLNQTNRTTRAIRDGFRTITRLVEVGLVFAVGQVASAMIKLQKEGLAFKQNIDITIQAVKNIGQVFRTGVLAGVSELAMAQVNLGIQLGNIKNVSKELIESTVELNNVYNIAEKTAAQINAQLFRWNGRSGDLVKFSQQYVVALSKINNQIPADIIEQMAQNTDELARYANQGAEGFAKQLIVLNKMGVSMKSISALADRLVMDFEGSLESAAKLQTFLPGFDISGIQFASQFGTNEQVAVELQTALQRSGLGSLDRLPRSLQNAVSGALGMSLTEIQNLLTGTEENTKNKQPTNADFDDKFERLANSGMNAARSIVDAFKDGNNKILAYLIARDTIKGLAGSLSIRKAGANFSTAGRLIGGSPLSRGVITRFGKFARPLARIGTASPLIGAGISLATGGGVGGAAGGVAGGAFGAALGSVIAPGIGTAIGGVLGSFIGDSLGRNIERLVRGTDKLAKKTTEAADAEKEKISATKLSKKASEEAAIKQELAAAGVKDLAAGLKKYSEMLSAGSSAVAGRPASLDASISSGFFAKAVANISDGWDWAKSKFAGVFHEGGVVGEDNMVGKGNSLSDLKNLKPQETIAILEKGEVVLTSSQMSAMGRAIGGGMRGNINNIISGFMNSFNLGSNRIVQSIRSSLTDKGGFLGKIGSFFQGGNIGQVISSRLSGITGKLGPIGEKVQGLAGGLLERGKSFLSGKASNFLSGLTGKGNSGMLGKAASFLQGGSGGIGGLLGGGVKSTAANIVSKIPGIGNLAGSFIKGGGVKGIGSSLLKGGLAKLGGAKIGAAIGSVIPGAGTIVGALLGTGISKLANTGVGKFVGNILGKTPAGAVARRVGGAIKSIGGKIGGFFGRRRRKESAPSVTPTDVGALAGIAGGTSNIQGMPDILSMFGGAGDAGLGGAVAGLPGINVTGGSSSSVVLDTKNLEGKIDQLINLMRSGGIAVNLDGRKVSTGLMEANRYG
jgi:hypothetical protein